MSPDGLDHGPNHGHYRVEAEYPGECPGGATVHAFAELVDEARLTAAAFAADGADVTVTAWCEVTRGYNTPVEDAA